MNSDPSATPDPSDLPSSNKRRGYPRKVRGDGRAIREEPRREWKPVPGTPASGTLPDRASDSGSIGRSESHHPIQPSKSESLLSPLPRSFDASRVPMGEPDQNQSGSSEGPRRNEPFWMRVQRERLERRPLSSGGGSSGSRSPTAHSRPPTPRQSNRDDNRSAPRQDNNPDARFDPRRDPRHSSRPSQNSAPVRPPRPEYSQRTLPQRTPPPRPEEGQQAGHVDHDPQGSMPSQMTPLQLAARIVDRTSDENPADMVLRQTLYRRRGLSPYDAAWISRAVFSFFRWQRWMNHEHPLEDRIREGVEFANRFSKEPSSFSDAELVERSLPDWAAAHMPVTAELARAVQTEPSLWLRCRPAFTEETIYQLRDTEPGPLPDSLRYTGRADLFLDRGFQSGAYEIQDLASQAVGLVCNPHPPEIWWDACAGEGGKTLHLSSLIGGKSLIWASDRAEWRLERLRQRTGRAKCFNYRAVHWDGGEIPPTKTRFDGILVDAPCSGIGTWGRNPHSRWTTTLRDVEELAAIQKRLLMNVADSLKPGGRLIYSACTLTNDETSQVADWFTNERPEFETLAMMNPFQPDEPPVTQMHLWPQQTGGNGMFVAAWTKG